MDLAKLVLKSGISDQETVTTVESRSRPQPRFRPGAQFVAPSSPPAASRYPRRLTIWGTILLALFCGSSSLSPSDSAPTHDATPVLLITIDTLRWDRLGCYGARSVRTPAMDSLAAQGARFENALSQVPITFPSHAVILSGTYPMYNGTRHYTSPSLPRSVGLLPEAFRRHGYDTAAFVSSFVLDSSWGLNRGFQTYDDRLGPRQSALRSSQDVERRADETVGHILNWFQARARRGAATPFFVWLHLYDPHSPYDPPEPFRSQYAGRLYDGEVAFADSQLARLFDFLRKSGLYDRTLIVLLADHGESLGEHGEDEHGFFIYNSTLHVPLIFKLPRGEGAPRVVRRLVGTIDVAPTVLDLLHLRDGLSRQFQGTSLASDILGKGGAAARPVYSETYYPRDSFGWSELACLTTDRYKYIQAPHPELYEIDQDPQEMRNLYGENSALAASLREQLTGVERRYSSTQAALAGPPLSPESVEKLKSLGYFAYSAPLHSSSGEPLPDPKDRLKLYKATQRARLLSSSGRREEANALLATLASEEPDFYLVPFLQAENFAQARRWNDAERSYLACLKLNPNFEQAIMGLAYLHLRDEGDAAKAKPWLELAVRQNPHNLTAYFDLGVLARLEKNNEAACRYFLKAIEENLDYALSQQELGITLVDLKRYQESLGPLSRAESLGQEDPRLEQYFGTALANVGRFKDAVEHYRKALKMKADFAEARLSLALTYLNLGDRADATREFRTLCGQNSSLCEQYRQQFE
ncbi:MAG: sulfatase-like hydrolase/transferase [Terriglobia bacterium]